MLPGLGDAGATIDGLWRADRTPPAFGQAIGSDETWPLRSAGSRC
jgi:hypothetical protein